MTPAIRVQVLGPIRAWRGQHEISLGPPQQRCVLALIALAAGRPVPTSSLVDALWAASPPRSAVNVVHTYIKRLRRLLEPGRPTRTACDLLPSIGNGYALRAEPEVVDLWRFQALLQTARQARRAGHDRRVLSALTQALALWHGQPACDLPTGTFHPRLLTVTKEHATAASWLAEAALACGQAPEALPLVEDAGLAQPYDEPLQANLVRLYHASGRRADAVEVFHQARCRLRDAFGFDPGPELTAAYRALLRDEQHPVLSQREPVA